MNFDTPYLHSYPIDGEVEVRRLPADAFGPVPVLRFGEPPPAPPENTEAPVITGTPARGETLTCSDGTWLGDDLVFTYQWFAADEEIEGETQNTFDVPSDMPDDTFVFCRVTASNESGTESVDSNTVMIDVAPPVNNTAPTITGTPTRGSTLTVTPGTWTGAEGVSYQWRVNGNNVSGQTGLTFVVPVSVQNGDDIDCVETATNDGGSTSVVSNTLVASVPPPENTEAPVITGTPARGETLTCSDGTWLGDDLVFTYQWFAANVEIEGETQNTFDVPSDMPDDTFVFCRVTAANDSGTVSADSNAVMIDVVPPVNNTAPSVTGTPTRGSTLTVTPGTWTGSEGVSYQWRVNGNNVSGQTSLTFVVSVSVLDGDAIDCVETATNDGGSTSATSNTLVASVPAPVNTVAPEISGTPVHDAILTTTDGTWTGPDVVFTYQWRINDDDVEGETNSTFQIPDTTVPGDSITCVVTGTNSTGSNSAISNSLSLLSP